MAMVADGPPPAEKDVEPHNKVYCIRTEQELKEKTNDNRNKKLRPERARRHYCCHSSPVTFTLGFLSRPLLLGPTGAAASWATGIGLLTFTSKDYELPCRIMSKKFRELSMDTKFKEAAAFFEMDVDDFQDLARQYKLDVYPAFLLLNPKDTNKEVGARVTGLNPSKLESSIEEALNPAPALFRPPPKAYYGPAYSSYGGGVAYAYGGRYGKAYPYGGGDGATNTYGGGDGVTNTYGGGSGYGGGDGATNTYGGGGGGGRYGTVYTYGGGYGGGDGAANTYGSGGGRYGTVYTYGGGYGGGDGAANTYGGGGRYGSGYGGGDGAANTYDGWPPLAYKRRVRYQPGAYHNHKAYPPRKHPPGYGNSAADEDEQDPRWLEITWS